MDLIKRLFGAAKTPEEPAAPPRPDGRPDSRTPAADSQSIKRRELVRMLTRDMQRITGIPDGWIDSQVLLELGQSGQTLVHLRLIVRHWDERLLKYAVAFQRRLREEVERYEPEARQWLLSITWQYEVGTQCPFQAMPEAASWTAARAAVAKPEPEPEPEPISPRDEEEEQMRVDLERLFAVRDANLNDAGRGPAPNSAAPAPGRTPAPEPGALQRKGKP